MAWLRLLFPFSSCANQVVFLCEGDFNIGDQPFKHLPKINSSSYPLQFLLSLASNIPNHHYPAFFTEINEIRLAISCMVSVLTGF